jgi:hypothetical protein
MADHPTKTCKNCGTDKPLGDYSHDHSKPDGLNVYCRACLSARMKARRQRIRALPASCAASQRCYLCRKIKPNTAFRRDRGRITGLDGYCNSCRKILHRQRLRRLEASRNVAGGDLACKAPPGAQRAARAIHAPWKPSQAVCERARADVRRMLGVERAATRMRPTGETAGRTGDEETRRTQEEGVS